MITGDHPVTAKAIAKEVGIISPGNKTIEDAAEEKGVPLDRVDSRNISAAVILGSGTANYCIQFYWYYAPGINTKCHICPAHYFFYEIAESGKAWQQKNYCIKIVLLRRFSRSYILLLVRTQPFRYSQHSMPLMMLFLLILLFPLSG
jgi:magnesium-transporting ATPase (P-type)